MFLHLQATALTSAVNASALVAEGLSAAATHVIAPLGALDPESAVRALFELLALSEGVEGIV